MKNRMMGSHFSSPGALPSISKDIFQGFGGFRSRPASPPPARRVAPSVFRRAERENVTKYIIKSPKFIPSSTQDRLRAEAKIIVKKKNEFTKQEYEYAQNLLHPDRVLKTAKQKLENTIGNIQTLTEIKDRGIHDVWAATHKTKEVAKGANMFEEKTLLEQSTPLTPEPPKETQRITRPAIGPGAPQSTGGSSANQGTQASWKVQEKGTTPHTISNQASHASAMHSTSQLGSFSAGALHYGIHSQHGTSSAEPDMFAPAAPGEPTPPPQPTTSPETSTPPAPPTPDIPSADSVHDLAID